jgi:queuine/archaeosine tRNA-ribosyltransferase
MDLKHKRFSTLYGFWAYIFAHLTRTQRKRPEQGLLPAIERYDGVHFRVLRKAKREGYWPRNLEVLIVSAKYGLLELDPKAIPYGEILDSLKHVRQTFADKEIHVFGVGGTATIHLAFLLEMNSVDSSGWRNRAARGIVQLPGRGDRMVTNLGSWRGREPSNKEWDILAACLCPACWQFGIEGLKTNGLPGFSNRATHNLWTLLYEARQIEAHLTDGSYQTWYTHHLDNPIYLPLVQQALNKISLISL